MIQCAIIVQMLVTNYSTHFILSAHHRRYIVQLAVSTQAHEQALMLYNDCSIRVYQCASENKRTLRRRRLNFRIFNVISNSRIICQQQLTSGCMPVGICHQYDQYVIFATYIIWQYFIRAPLDFIFLFWRTLQLCWNWNNRNLLIYLYQNIGNKK